MGSSRKDLPNLTAAKTAIWTLQDEVDALKSALIDHNKGRALQGGEGNERYHLGEDEHDHVVNGNVEGERAANSTWYRVGECATGDGHGEFRVRWKGYGKRGEVKFSVTCVRGNVPIVTVLSQGHT